MERRTMERKVLVIAEAGVNHNGDLALAERLVDVAASAGPISSNSRPSPRIAW